MYVTPTVLPRDWQRIIGTRPLSSIGPVEIAGNRRALILPTVSIVRYNGHFDSLISCIIEEILREFFPSLGRFTRRSRDTRPIMAKRSWRDLCIVDIK